MSPTIYATNPRALQRWRAERLTLTPESDGGLDAVFRFEGSTCGNIPFSLVYQVKLGPAEEGRVIRSMDCYAPGDSAGHERMCVYLSAKERFMQLLHTECPLLGEPLDAVLAWKPTALAAGCLCARAARDYKWRAVLETIHLALHPAETKTATAVPTSL